MGLFNFFKKKSLASKPANNTVTKSIRNMSVPQTFYQFTYYHLPKIFFEDPQGTIIKINAEREGFVISEIIKFCNSKGISMDKIIADRISVQINIENQSEIAVINYPKVQEEYQNFSGMNIPILTPCFVSLVKKNTEFFYFTYGNSPSGGLTFRNVDQYGTNSNLGPATGQNKESFIIDIKTYIK